ncbi:hypothetical protein ABZX51_011695 [Aspergillus tubingensis]
MTPAYDYPWRGKIDSGPHGSQPWLSLPTDMTALPGLVCLPTCLSHPPLLLSITDTRRLVFSSARILIGLQRLHLNFAGPACRARQTPRFPASPNERVKWTKVDAASRERKQRKQRENQPRDAATIIRTLCGSMALGLYPLSQSRPLRSSFSSLLLLPSPLLSPSNVIQIAQG